MTPVKIYLTETENQTLREAAAKYGQSISAFVKLHLKDIWQDDPAVYDDLPKTGRRNKSIKIHVSEEEYKRIKHLAGEIPVSQYARKLLLSGGHPISLTITTDDISAFDYEISERLMQFQNMIEALAYRSLLGQQESEKLLTTLSEIREDIKEITHYAKNNRKAIRSAGLRWLKRKYKEKTEEMP